MYLTGNICKLVPPLCRRSMVYTNILSAAQHNLPVMKKIVRLIYRPMYTVLGYPLLTQVYLKFCLSYTHV